MPGYSKFHRTNWLDKASVIAFAEKLGPGMTVHKHPNRPNYNICHTENETRFGILEEWVVHRTGGVSDKGPQKYIPSGYKSRPRRPRS